MGVVGYIALAGVPVWSLLCATLAICRAGHYCCVDGTNPTLTDLSPSQSPASLAIGSGKQMLFSDTSGFKQALIRRVHIIRVCWLLRGAIIVYFDLRLIYTARKGGGWGGGVMDDVKGWVACFFFFFSVVPFCITCRTRGLRDPAGRGGWCSVFFHLGLPRIQGRTRTDVGCVD